MPQGARILCLDQSTKITGWAFGTERSADRFEFGSFRVPKRDDEGERLVIFRDGVTELIEAKKPDIIGFETPFFPVGEQAMRPDKKNPNAPRRAAFNPKTIKALLHVEGVLVEVASRFNVPVEDYPSSSWRVTALGFGRLPAGSQEDFKKLMIKRAKVLGYEVRDDNEADAIGLLMHMTMGAPAAARAQGDLLAMATSRL